MKTNHRRTASRAFFITLLGALAMIAGCETDGSGSTASRAKSTDTMSLAQRVADTHQRDVWSGQPAVTMDITVSFGGGTPIDGTLWYNHHTGQVRIDQNSGTTMVFDGRRAWVSPTSADAPGARFHLLTWPYFLAMPFKLDDPGATLTDMGMGTLDSQSRRMGRLTFGAGVGDAPDDWYIIYTDPMTMQLREAAYIVTYGKDAAEAAEEPHAIRYERYRMVGGVPIPMRWTFWNWSEARGIFGDPLGEVTLRNVRFAAPPEGAFDKPADAREDMLPG
jgi:hypothetical protein